MKWFLKFLRWLMFWRKKPDAPFTPNADEMAIALKEFEQWQFTDFDAEYFTGKDFWNDPERWDGINPHKDMIWMVKSRPNIKFGNMIEFH